MVLKVIIGFLVLMLVAFSLLVYFGNDEPSLCIYMSEETAKEMGKYEIIDYDIVKAPEERFFKIEGIMRNNSKTNMKYVRVKMIEYEDEAVRTGEFEFPVNVKHIKPGETGEFVIDNLLISGSRIYKAVVTIDPPGSRILPWKLG
jgi:hypothetical protein